MNYTQSRRIATERERLVSDQRSVDSKIRRRAETIEKETIDNGQSSAPLAEIGRQIVKWVKMKWMRSDFDSLTWLSRSLVNRRRKQANILVYGSPLDCRTDQTFVIHTSLGRNLNTPQCKLEARLVSIA